MNLKEVRTKFVQFSGRYDLVVDTTDWVDNGADFYINNAIKLLGRLAIGVSDKARLFYELSSGDYSVTFQHHCRVLKDVWVNNTEERYQLEKKSLDELRALYGDLVTATESGAPLYFAIAELRTLETTDRDSLGIYLDKTWEDDDEKYNYRGIVIAPPLNESYVVEVNGLFKNVELSADDDENFWTLEEYDLLIRTALYDLESISRGTENAKNWLSRIKDDVKEINFDIAEEESHGINQLEG